MVEIAKEIVESVKKKIDNSHIELNQKDKLKQLVDNIVNSLNKDKQILKNHPEIIKKLDTIIIWFNDILQQINTLQFEKKDSWKLILQLLSKENLLKEGIVKVEKWDNISTILDWYNIAEKNRKVLDSKFDESIEFIDPKYALLIQIKNIPWVKFEKNNIVFDDKIKPEEKLIAINLTRRMLWIISAESKDKNPDIEKSIKEIDEMYKKIAESLGIKDSDVKNFKDNFLIFMGNTMWWVSKWLEHITKEWIAPKLDIAGSCFELLDTKEKFIAAIFLPIVLWFWESGMVAWTAMWLSQISSDILIKLAIQNDKLFWFFSWFLLPWTSKNIENLSWPQKWAAFFWWILKKILQRIDIKNLVKSIPIPSFANNW